MNPDLESLIKDFEDFNELFVIAAIKFKEIGFYDRDLMHLLVNMVQQKAAAIDRKLENE